MTEFRFLSDIRAIDVGQIQANFQNSTSTQRLPIISRTVGATLVQSFFGMTSALGVWDSSCGKMFQATTTGKGCLRADETAEPII